MDKTAILSKATNTVKTTKKPNIFLRLGRWHRAQWRGFCAMLGRAWQCVKKADKLVFINILLLALVSAMLLVMLSQVKKSKAARPVAVVEQVVELKIREYNLADRLDMRDRPTVVVSRAAATPRPSVKRVAKKEVKKPVVAPVAPTTLKKVKSDPVTPRAKNIALPILRDVPADAPKGRNMAKGNVLVDGVGKRILPANTTVSGDLVLQNMNSFTLPCGVRVKGNLVLEDVRLLKFCGCFEITGNIYVSKNSSFGPLPKDGVLRGSVMFR